MFTAESLGSIEKPKENKNHLKSHNLVATTVNIIVYSTCVHACAVCMHVRLGTFHFIKLRL